MDKLTSWERTGVPALQDWIAEHGHLKCVNVQSWKPTSRGAVWYPNYIRYNPELGRHGEGIIYLTLASIPDDNLYADDFSRKIRAYFSWLNNTSIQPTDVEVEAVVAYTGKKMVTSGALLGTRTDTRASYILQVRVGEAVRFLPCGTMTKNKRYDDYHIIKHDSSGTN